MAVTCFLVVSFRSFVAIILFSKYTFSCHSLRTIHILRRKVLEYFPPTHLYKCKGSFTNYVDNILDFFTAYPPVLTIFMVWTLTKSGHFKTTYLPYHVNVACERPLSMIYVLIKVRKFQNQIVLFSFSPKNQQFVSALWVQNGSNKKRHNIILNWGLFNMINCLYFFGLTHFRLLGQKLLGGALNKSKYQLFDGLG